MNRACQVALPGSVPGDGSSGERTLVKQLLHFHTDRGGQIREAEA